MLASRYDVTMKDIRRLLFNEQPAKESRKRRRARWWAKHFGGCAVWHVCSAEPIRGAAPADALPENLLELQVQGSLPSARLKSGPTLAVCHDGRCPRPALECGSSAAKHWSQAAHLNCQKVQNTSEGDVSA